MGLFLFLGTAALNKSNPDKQIKVSNKGLSAFLWISLFAGIVTGQIDYTFWQNIVVIICAGIIIVLFLFIDMPPFVNFLQMYYTISFLVCQR